jgi:hypothetical protein
LDEHRSRPRESGDDSFATHGGNTGPSKHAELDAYSDSVRDKVPSVDDHLFLGSELEALKSSVRGKQNFTVAMHSQHGGSFVQHDVTNPSPLNIHFYAVTVPE